VKARLSRDVAGANDFEVLKRAQEVASSFKLPVMIHMGQTISPLPKLLALLKSGDVVTHMFAPPPNSIIDDSGHILPEVTAARRRGVLFDLGNGRSGHLRWDIAERVLQAGFLPDTFDAFKKQRHRWAYGGFQILRKHWRHLLPGAPGLTREQKREFGVGWLNWLGAEAIGVVVAILNLLWVPVVAFAGIAIPDKILTLPILAAFVVTFVHFVALYRMRVAIPFGQMMAAVVAAMSVQWTVARAVGYGIWKESLPFMRTAKGGATSKGPDFPAFWEAVLAALLLIGAVIVVATNYKQIHEINIFALVLVVQSLPFLAAVAIGALEASRFNSFAFWHGIRARVALPGRAVVAKAPTDQKSVVSNQ